MVVYSIKDMESLSGVKAHTIRIWEKRYNIIQPKRTKTNIRYYTDDDLKQLLNVCILYRNGTKISVIAKMSDAELKESINKIPQHGLNIDEKIDSLLLFILELDAYNFNKVLDKHINFHGIDKTIEELIYPLMDKLSIAWLTGSFQDMHESFVSQIIKCKIMHAIEQLDENANASPCFIIFLPEGEKQELSLMYLHYQLKKVGCKVINLGNEVGLKDVLTAINTCKTDYIFTILNEELKTDSLNHYINEICEHLKGKTFLLTGFQTLRLDASKPSNLVVLSNLEETLNFIRQAKGIS